MRLEPGKLQKIIGGLALAAVILLLAFFISDDITNAGNESSRLALVQSMIDHGTFAVEKSSFRTVDVGKLNGHFYSDKPILFSAWLAGVYAFVKHVLMISFQPIRNNAIYLINLLGVSVFTIGLYWLFLRRLKRETGCFYLKTALAASLIFCTWIFSYTVSINNHTVAAFLVFGLFLMTEKAIEPGEKSRSFIAFLAGLAGGLLCAVENPVGGIFSLASMACLLTSGQKQRWKMLGLFFVGGLIPAAAMAALDYCGWGNILPVYLIKDAYNFKGNIHSTDLAGLRRPENYFIYFFNITLGARGLFSHLPFLLLIFPAMLIPKGCFPKGALRWFLIACGVTILFYALFTGDYGGWAYGFRFLIPIIPILYLVICKWLLQDAKKFFMIIAWPLLAVGLVTSAIGAYNPWPVCAEGASTNKKSIDVKIESPLKANLLCILYEFGGPKQAFESGLYDHNTVKYYLPKALMNMGRLRKSTPDNPSFLMPRQTRPLTLFAENYVVPVFYLGLFAVSIFYLAGRCGGWLFAEAKTGPTKTYMFYVMAMTLFAMLAVLLTGTLGILKPYCLTAIPVILALWLLVRQPGPILKMSRIEFRKEYWLFLVPGILILCRLAVFLPFTPNAWDSMTYHLFIPLRWMQTGEIFHVPTVFGDNAAAYAPKNGGLIYAAIMTLMHRDLLLNVLSLAYLLFAACALFEICRELKGCLTVRCGAAAFFMSTPFIMDKAFSSDVDIMALAFLTGGVYYYLRCLKNKQLLPALYGGLCLGLAVGAKTAYAPFGGVVAAALLLLLLWRKRWTGTFGAFGLMFIGGGFWYIFNLLKYGSPLFPAEVAVGKITIFPGAYGEDALRAGEFYITDVSLLARQFFHDCAYLTGAVLIIGLIGLLFNQFSGKTDKRNNLIVMLLGLIWLLIYYFIIPHNQQIRFLFPTLAMAFIGLSLLLDKLPLKAQFVVYAGALMFYCGGNAGRMYKALNGLTWWPAVWLLTLLVATVILVLRTRRYYLAAVLLLIALFSAMRESEQMRVRCLVKGDFGMWWKTFAPFNTPRPTPLKIAYTGLNIPYTLTGPNLANEVFYCNISGNQEDGFYEFWEKEPERYKYHKPAVYRKKPNPKQWLENLFNSGAEYLVIFAMHPAERRYLPATKEGFPVIEQTLIDRLPQFFKLELSSPGGRIYRIVPPPPAK